MNGFDNDEPSLNDYLEDEDTFAMTRSEVEYFLNSIAQEYLSKDTYYMAIALIKRMRAFIDEGK